LTPQLTGPVGVSAPHGDMKVPAGQFRTWPNNLLRVVNEPFAAALIYAAALAAWTYLALLYVNPSLGKLLSGGVFIVGSSILIYDWTLRRADKRREAERNERERRPSPDTQAQAATGQP
jgi:hypothetical protein